MAAALTAGQRKGDPLADNPEEESDDCILSAKVIAIMCASEAGEETLLDSIHTNN